MINYLTQLAQIVRDCPSDPTGASCTVNLPQVDAGATSPAITNALQLVFGIIGAVAVFFIIMGGLKFITSQGDPQGIGKARKTIIYAAVGLAVALSAEAIVTFVLGKL